MKKLLYAMMLFAVVVACLGFPTRVAAADPIEITNIVSPGVVGPGLSICFSVTVKINSGQLLESRGDMLRNTGGELLGSWPHIAVTGTHNTGSTYTFSCYKGSMTSPTTEGIHESKWRVWQNSQYVGNEVVIRFEVKKGAGGGPQPTVPPPSYTEGECKPTDAKVWAAPNKDGMHNYIELTIPEGEVLLDRHVQSKNGLLTFLASKLYSMDKWQVEYNKINSTIPENHWRIFIPERVMAAAELIDKNFLVDYAVFPADMVYLMCRYKVALSEPDQYFPIVQNLALGSPKPGSQYRIPVEVPNWVTWLQTDLHKGSNATITLVAPDGTIYSPSNSSVTYTDQSTFAVHTLKLDAPKGGTWQVVVDVTAAEETSVFLLDVAGKQYDDPANDNVPPVTGMHLDGTKGLNSWFTSNVVVTLSASDNPGGSGVKGTEWSTDNGVTWKAYTGPFTVSQEGSSYVLARSYDNKGNYEQSPVGKFFLIDKTPPVVTVSTDQAEYTRVQPYVVHFSGYDPQPGSGLATLSAQFNNQPVVDGQTFDLLWFHLGKYTLTATGVDNAGWTTTKSVSWQLIATIESMKASLSRFCSEGYVTDKGTCNSLQQKLDAAKAARDRKQYTAAVNVLTAFNAEVSAQTNKKIPQKVAAILQEDANYVIGVLKTLK